MNTKPDYFDKVFAVVPQYRRLYMGVLENVSVVIRHRPLAGKFWIVVLDANGEKVDSLIHPVKTLKTAKKYAANLVDRCAVK